MGQGEAEFSREAHVMLKLLHPHVVRVSVFERV